MRLAVLEDADRAREVVVDELARTGLAVDAREYAGIGRRIQHEVGGGQGVHGGNVAQVRGEHLDAELFQRAAVGLAAGPDEIVEAADLVTGRMQRAGKGATDETADAGDEDAHGTARETERSFQVKREIEPRPCGRLVWSSF